VPSFRHTIDIDATPERVWEVLGDISSVDRWIPGVTSVAVEGMSRVCGFEDGHSQNEQILDYSPETRSYRYLIEGAPLPVADNTGTFRVEAADGRARVVWESSFRALNPSEESELAEMWEPYLPMVLAKLKSVVDT
jgi:carbon monoxide dehydrogenase subunit G